MKLRGFTVVEVVVAVAIVTLLAAIVIPDLWAAQQRITGEMFMNSVHDITTTLELYKKEHSGLYPTQLEELASYFDKQPINQYTRSSMLSSNTYQSGVQYTPSADRKSYTLVVTQRDVNDLDRDKNKTETVPEALGQPFSFGNVQPITPTVARTYIVTLRAVPNNTGQLVAFPNPAKAGQTVMLSQKPANCYDFSSWSSSDVTISDNSFTMPAKDVTVTASYTIRQYTVSAAPNNPSYGTVTGADTYNCGSTATLTAVPTTGYTFEGWYESGSQVSTATTYTFTVNDNRTLEARFATNITIAFTRNSVAYTSDGTQVAANQPRFEQGQFGQAIFIEEGTTNLLTAEQSSVETNLEGLGGRRTPELERDLTTAWHGDASLRGVKHIEFSISTSKEKTPITAGVPYTGSVYTKSSAQQSQLFSLYWHPGNTDASTSVDFTTEWKRAVVSGIAPLKATESYLELYSNGNYTIWWDGAQLEAKPYATSWTLGGTTRAAETLSISPVSNILTPQQGTIDVWVDVPEFWKSGIPNSRRIWTIGTATETGVYYLGYNPTNDQIEFSVVSDVGTAQTIRANKPAVGWHLFTARWSNNEMSLWIDGVMVGSISNPVLPSRFADNKLYLGNMPNISMSAINTYIDDFRISSIARTDAEIQTLYQSNQPAPKDADTTLKLTFDGNLTP